MIRIFERYGSLETFCRIFRHPYELNFHWLAVAQMPRPTLKPGQVSPPTYVGTAKKHSKVSREVSDILDYGYRKASEHPLRLLQILGIRRTAADLSFRSIVFLTVDKHGCYHHFMLLLLLLHLLRPSMHSAPEFMRSSSRAVYSEEAPAPKTTCDCQFCFDASSNAASHKKSSSRSNLQMSGTLVMVFHLSPCTRSTGPRILSLARTCELRRSH